MVGPRAHQVPWLVSTSRYAPANNIILLNDNQHGFRSHYSYVTQLIFLVEDLSCSMDHQKQTDVILLDFAKAFDSIPHQRLLVKLKHYGIHDNICKWIETWLTQRFQKVVLDGVSSNSKPVHSGVPQGTILGPLMFLIYINDITEHISSSLRLFTDESVMTVCCTEILLQKRIVCNSNMILINYLLGH